MIALTSTKFYSINRVRVSFYNLIGVGAGDEIRTHDFNLGKVALYP